MALKCTADTNVVAIASSNEMSDNMIIDYQFRHIDSAQSLS